jgi:arsenite-transporting ATPase
MSGWVERQSEVVAEAREALQAVPVLEARQRFAEVVGLEDLRSFAGEAFGDLAPAAVWVTEPPVQWEDRGDSAELSLRLPFLKKDSFRLLAGPDGLVLNVGGQRRIIPLPESVGRRPMLGARYEDGKLLVRFGAAPGG